MDTAELIAVCVTAYIATGLALTGYDFSAPPLHQKFYVINQDYRIAALIWIAWPVTSMREIWLTARFHSGDGFRLFAGVVMLAVGMYFWGRAAFTIADRFIGVFWVNTIATFIALALLSPIITYIVMPKHGGKNGSITGA